MHTLLFSIYYISSLDDYKSQYKYMNEIIKSEVMYIEELLNIKFGKIVHVMIQAPNFVHMLICP